MIRSKYGSALISVFIYPCLTLLTQAETLILWQDDGNGQNLTGEYTTRYNGFQSANSTGTVVDDPSDTTHGGVHELVMNGTNDSSTEWGALLLESSPYAISSDSVWDDRIVPGETEFTFTGEFFIPDSTPMSGSDAVYLLLRFYADGGTYNDGNLISVTSQFYDESSSGSWISAKVEGIIPATNDVGEPIARIQPIVPVSDFLPNATTDTFVYIDNVKLTVEIPASAPLPPHQITQQPSKLDADSNGLPDLWERLFGAYNVSQSMDSDGDGLSNAKEAEFGTDPFDSSSYIGLELSQDESGSSELTWPDLYLRSYVIESSTDLGVSDPWTPIALVPNLDNGQWQALIDDSDSERFYRAYAVETDGDSDSIPDWLEGYFGFYIGSGSENSSGEPRSYDTTGDGNPDVTLGGDLASFNEIYLSPDLNTQMTEAQASRFLMQATFGPKYEDIQYLKRIGPEVWLDEQVGLSKTYTMDYVGAVKADFDNGGNSNPDPELAGYGFSIGSFNFLRGHAFQTGWARAALHGQDRLRQRVAFALSQILVASSKSAGMGNQPVAISHYYDQFIDEAFGNYEDLLNKVARHSVMGNYLSSIGNQKADPTIERYPDENFARELMQLFTIGLWELNIDGTRKLDLSGEPIPTYGNPEITELARVYTGVNYASTNFGGGYLDDGFFMTTPMKVFPDEHDFGAKTLVTGHVIPARSETEEAAIQDVEDSIYHLVRHPNTAPFICRQLIQFLVSDNPTPEFVARVATVFQNNGSGVVGDLEAVVRAILLDDEARDPLEHLGTAYFGSLREPVVRVMHLARVMQVDRFPNLEWWDWGNFAADSLQRPMESPSVFNYYRPDFRMRGELADSGLDSPVFGIIDSYSAIAFPNRLWSIVKSGFRGYIGGGNDYHFPPDWSELSPLTGDLDALLDRVNLLFCAGTMSARSREVIHEVLSSTSNSTQRVQLAVYLSMICPEGACIK
ncbi:MAG: DUF1800 family protein [Opitutaceae bacterium]